MFILTQNNETGINVHGKFMVSYRAMINGSHLVVYIDTDKNSETILGEYNSKDACIEQVGITMMQIADGKNVFMPSKETMADIHAKRGKK